MIKYCFHISLLILAVSCSRTHINSIKSDNTIIAPESKNIEFLKKNFDENRALVLAFANHDNQTVYQYLIPLLEKLKDDPSLKTIVLERSFDLSDMYQQLSTKSTEEVLTKYSFASPESKQMALCGSSEWSYSIANFMPVIRQINEYRAEKGIPKIIVKSVDSMSSSKPMLWPMKIEDIMKWPENAHEYITKNTCGFIGAKGGEQPMWAYSENREMETAQNFYNEIWRKIDPEEKVIIAYHALHSLPGIERCGLFMNSEKDWLARRSKMTWYDHFLELAPDADQRFTRILLDEKADSYHPNGVLKITKELLKDLKVSDYFEVKTSEIRGKSIGVDLFEPEIFSDSFDAKSKLTLDQLLKGVIWTSDANIRFALKESFDYLPEYCPKEE